MTRSPGKNPDRSGGSSQPQFPREIAVLYEDDAIVAVDKPPGLLAVPVKGKELPSALSVLCEELESKRQQALIVHRIDRFASGVLLFAKTERDRDALVRQFLNHTPLREYQAVIRGYLRAKEGTLIHIFRKQGQFQKIARKGDPNAAHAELHYSLERPLRSATLVRVRLITGLQNQIRAQFAAIGNPLVGDRKYSPEEASETRINRVALHAERLEFIHPRSGQTVSLSCEPPSDFQALVRALMGPN
jgi:23S rRNA pseudouridine1911/1915/1917 synthase